MSKLIFFGIEGNTAGPRDQRKFLKILMSFEDSCFYCGTPLGYGSDTHVDHVIPFDYIADTDLWNLVLACQECNCQKSGRLPPQRYLTKLLERNASYQNNPVLNKSLKMLNYDDGSIEWHYNNAHIQGYPTLQDFPKTSV